jgi:protein-disulfide isomerase
MSYLKKIIIPLSILTLLVLQQAQAAVIVGNPKGSVTLSFVYDYQCMHCHRMFPLVQKLISDNHDLRVALYPVAVINEYSIFEAAFAIAATRDPKKFKEFTTFLMTHKPVQDQGLQKILHKLKLDDPASEDAAHSQWVQAQILQGLQIMQAANADSVPVFVINNKKVLIGEQSYRTLEKAIKDARRA